MHPSFGDGANLGNLIKKDLVLFFKACEVTFLVGMASLKEMLFGLESLDFEEREEKLRWSHQACQNF